MLIPTDDKARVDVSIAFRQINDCYLDGKLRYVTYDLKSQSPFGKSTIVTTGVSPLSNGGWTKSQSPFGKSTIVTVRSCSQRPNGVSCLNRLSANQRLLHRVIPDKGLRDRRSQSPFGKSTIVTIADRASFDRIVRAAGLNRLSANQRLLLYHIFTLTIKTNPITL